MIQARLSAEEVPAAFRVLNPFSVPFDDPRLRDVAMSWDLGLTLLQSGRPSTDDGVLRLVAWHDGALGVVQLWKDPARRAESARQSYEIGRRALERASLEGCDAQSIDQAH